MHEDDIPVSVALDLMIDEGFRRKRDEQEQAELVDGARKAADDARLALAALAPEALKVIAYRLLGAPAEGGQGALKAGEFPIDGHGRPVTKEREDSAWEVLSRIGVPRLRATAVAASLSTAPTQAAPGSPGWVPDADEDDDAQAALTEGSIDAQIASFMAGVQAQKNLGHDD